jgi:hypothetical protein
MYKGCSASYMVQLQPGRQSCNDLRLSCCASIANDVSPSYNSLRELFLPFLFSRTERTRFVCCGCASTDMQISQSRWQDLCVVVWSSCNQSTSLATICACRVARRSQTTFRPATTVSGNSFSTNYFFLFSFLFSLFSHRANAFRLERIARRPTCKSAEADGKTYALW